MEAIYLSLRTQVAVGTFFIKSSVFRTFKFELLELRGGGSNKKITNIIDDQGPKTYL